MSLGALPFWSIIRTVGAVKQVGANYQGRQPINSSYNFSLEFGVFSQHLPWCIQRSLLHCKFLFYLFMCLTLTVAQVLKGVNAAAAGLMASAFLMLWLKVIKDSAPRAASAVFLLALQLIFSLKAPQVIGIGAVAGVAYGFVVQ
jgi:hypothetical protein